MGGYVLVRVVQALGRNSRAAIVPSKIMGTHCHPALRYPELSKLIEILAISRQEVCHECDGEARAEAASSWGIQRKLLGSNLKSARPPA